MPEATEEVDVTGPAPAPRALPVATSRIPADARYIGLWFNENEDLKFESRGLNIYMIVAALRAATIQFEKKLVAPATVPAEATAEKN